MEKKERIKKYLKNKQFVVSFFFFNSAPPGFQCGAAAIIVIGICSKLLNKWFDATFQLAKFEVYKMKLIENYWKMKLYKAFPSSPDAFACKMPWENQEFQSIHRRTNGIIISYEWKLWRLINKSELNSGLLCFITGKIACSGNYMQWKLRRSRDENLS